MLVLSVFWDYISPINFHYLTEKQVEHIEAILTLTGIALLLHDFFDGMGRR
jgi:hypothetical protein